MDEEEGDEKVGLSCKGEGRDEERGMRRETEKG